MKSKYHATGNYLEELPGEKPKRPKRKNYDLTGSMISEAMLKYEFELAKYKGQLGNLRRISCHPSCAGKWSDGQEVEENVDYKVCSAFEFEQGGVYEPMAFPLPVKSEDDLWKEAAEKLALTFFGDEPVGSQGYCAALQTYEEEMEVLKQYFTLTKK